MKAVHFYEFGDIDVLRLEEIATPDLKSEDVADIVAFLVNEQARWIAGQNIRATGGLA